MEVVPISPDTKPNRSHLAWVILGSVLVLVILSGAVAAAYGFEAAFRNRLFPGVSAAGLRLDGLSREAARDALRAHIDRSLEPGFRFRFGEDSFDLPRAQIAVEDPDLSQDLVSFDVDATVEAAYQLGRGHGLLADSFGRLGMLLRRADLPLTPNFNRPLAERLLTSELASRAVMPQDADLKVGFVTGTKEIVTEIETERTGRAGDAGSALDTLEAQIKRLSFQPISVRTATILPRIKSTELISLKDGVPAFLDRANITLLSGGKKFAMTTSTLAGWVHASATSEGPVLAFDPDAIAEGLKPLLKDQLVEPKDGKLTLDEQGNFKSLETPAEGIVVDGRKTADDLLAAFLRGAPTSTVTLSRITPKITGEDAERLGITELLGVGRSNFAGSPTNRRRNIALGAKKMNGVLIPPDGDFSQLKTLGPVDGPHGWFQELVIKGDTTIPEYGGGLCQIGTTSFRAALASGMPILERRAHSYRVVYYEPAGTDATIYDPAPDFRFKNDTPGHLLITSQIQGDNLLFFVWGSKDGRVATQTKPRVYNIVPPPPKKIIPTTTLPPGKTKCTESAHAGASAEFTYAVTYADGTEKKETFTSQYRPWGAVCLVGTAELPAAPVDAGVDQTGLNNPQL